MEKNQRKHTVGNGEGSLFYSKSQQKWIYQWTEGFELGKQNKKQIKQRKNESKKDFLKRKTELENSKNNGTYIEKSKDTLLNILEKHIKQKLQDGIVEETSYIRDLETLEQIKSCCENFINKPIQKVSTEDIEASKAKIREYSKSCIDKIWRLLKKGFKIAYSRKRIPYNLMEDETLTKPISKKVPVKVQALTIKEQENLITILDTESDINPIYKDIILLQLYTGARIGEILALSTDCVDLKNNTLTIYRTLTRNISKKTKLGAHTKTFDKLTGIDKGKRTFPMQPKVKQIIERLLRQKITNIYGLLFWDYEDNTFIKYYEINSYLRRLNKKYEICNFSLSTHNLRHTFITRCQENDFKLPVLQAMVGHVEGSAITNNVYTDISVDFMEKELQKIL